MSTSQNEAARALTHGDILFVVNRYIGVDAGYLGILDGHLNSFNHSSLFDFFPEYCDIEIDTFEFEGTAREKFIRAIKESAPLNQAKILRGVLKRFPSTPLAPERKKNAKRIRGLIARLEQVELIDDGNLKLKSEVVRAALQDAQTLLTTEGPSRAVDRIHTALHGYLKAACITSGIETKEDPTIGALLRALRTKHPKLQDLGERSSDVTVILNSLGTIAGALNPIRNNASAAHPNENLVGDPEALLVINASKAIYLYLDKKLND
jgi:hypothetical protein